MVPGTPTQCEPTVSREISALDLRRKDDSRTSLSSFQPGGTPRTSVEISSSNAPCGPKMTRNTTVTADSTHRTSGCLSSLALSSSSSAAVLPTDGDKSKKYQSLDIPARSIRRRPRISDLHQYQSAPEALSTNQASQECDTHVHGKLKKRAVSAEPAARTRTRFTSPDRYAACRDTLHLSTAKLHTSQHPSSLTKIQRYFRQSLNEQTAFHSLRDVQPHTVTSQSRPKRLQPFRPPHYTPSFVQTGGIHSPNRPTASPTVIHRPVGHSIRRNAGWLIGSGQVYDVDTGTRFTAASGLGVTPVNSIFVSSDTINQRAKQQQERLALALKIDTAERVLALDLPQPKVSEQHHIEDRGYQWSNGGWITRSTARNIDPKPDSARREKKIPTVAFRVLDAPRLKDDYYCSVLAYCNTLRTLAVALTHRVYLWTERFGVRYPPLAPVRQANYVTSLSFSSDEGQKAILAISRNSGHVTLWSLLEQKARFELAHQSTACLVAFRPKVAHRARDSLDTTVACEDLLVGDDTGHIYYYAVRWPEAKAGSVTLLTKLEAHSQNICGLAWAGHGKVFASGGNDNCALLFHVEDVIQLQQTTLISSTSTSNLTSATQIPLDTPKSASSSILTTTEYDLSAESGQDWYNVQFSTQGAPPPTPPRSPAARPILCERTKAGSDIVPVKNAHRYSFLHSAAVKAIAFAPWQPTLLATGGGSNDKQIHFYHTKTGTSLAVINVFAQVTSLTWSQTRREIVATFGYAQPEHQVRIAVFAWPSCDCTVSIPWEKKSNGEVGRALWAIPYPGGPNDAAPERLQNPVESSNSWIAPNAHDGATGSGRAARSHDLQPGAPLTPEVSPVRRTLSRGEGETWASRTEEEGSLIIACCDQTIKFFEVWAGKSKGFHGLGSKAGVLGGSKVLEGLCEDVVIDEIGDGEDVIR